MLAFAGGAKNARMDWNRIASNWAHWKGRVRERWSRLTDDELNLIAGQRDRLTGRIQDAYGLSREEAERQLLNWERNLDVDLADFGADDEAEIAAIQHVNGRKP